MSHQSSESITVSSVTETEKPEGCSALIISDMETKEQKVCEHVFVTKEKKIPRGLSTHQVRCKDCDLNYHKWFSAQFTIDHSKLMAESKIMGENQDLFRSRMFAKFSEIMTTNSRNAQNRCVFDGELYPEKVKCTLVSHTSDFKCPFGGC